MPRKLVLRTTYESHMRIARWFMSFGTIIRGATGMVANQLFVQPFLVGRVMDFDRIGIEVTIGAGTLARLGLYKDNGDAQPGHLLGDFGTVATNGAGAKSIIIDERLQPGVLYWLASIFNGAPTVRSATYPNSVSIIGSNNVLDAAGTGWRFAQAFGALPADLTSVSPTAIINFGSVMLRRAV